MCGWSRQGKKPWKGPKLLAEGARVAGLPAGTELPDHPCALGWP